MDFMDSMNFKNFSFIIYLMAFLSFVICVILIFTSRIPNDLNAPDYEKQLDTYNNMQLAAFIFAWIAAVCFVVSAIIVILELVRNKS